jgi:hypothetical protein
MYLYEATNNDIIIVIECKEMSIVKSKSILSLILTATLALAGCSNKPVDKISTNPSPQTAPENKISEPTANVPKYYSPYTGEEVSKEAAAQPAYMAIVENSPDSWPQSGLTEADIVFEATVEGGITRHLALYQKENSAKIGPVRSMRTYYIDIAYEYNLSFAHCGGSHDALDRIKAEKTMNMDEMYNGSYFWRDKTIKVQEHSLYTSSEKLLELAAKKGYAKEPVSKLEFDKGYWDKLNSLKANNISMKFSGTYSTNYILKDGLYYKSMNNKSTLNKEDSKAIAVKNIVIQNVKYRSRSKEVYLDADLVGQGDGYIISDGKAIKVTWSKSDLKSPTIFKDEKGNRVPLNPGKTWWHLMDTSAKLTISE